MVGVANSAEATFTLDNEDHTLANPMKYMLNKEYVDNETRNDLSIMCTDKHIIRMAVAQQDTRLDCYCTILSIA